VKRRNWTSEEIEYLRENVGFAKLKTIAKNLDRTETSVELKMKRLGLSNTKSYTGQLTMGELAKLLQVDPKSVKLWTENHGLKFSKRATRSTRMFYFIKPKDFWEWAYVNKESVDFSKIEPNSIPPEPDWLKQERMNKKSINYKSWTTHEIKIMTDLYSRGSDFSDIGEKLNRSSISIQRKYQRLNCIKSAVMF
jgi:hypothetical protein